MASTLHGKSKMSSMSQYLFVCKYCQKRFQDIHFLKRHKRMKHLVERVIQKPKNEAKFNGSTSLVKTEPTEMSQNSSFFGNLSTKILGKEDFSWYQCDICLILLNGKIEFFIHKEMHNEESSSGGGKFHTLNGIMPLENLPLTSWEIFTPRIVLRPIENQLIECLRLIPSHSVQNLTQSNSSDVNSNCLNDQKQKLRKRSHIVFSKTKTFMEDEEEESGTEDDDTESMYTSSGDEEAEHQEKVARRRSRKIKRKFECKICRVVVKFRAYNALLDHITQHHKKENYLRCSVCEFKTESIDSIQVHMDTHPLPSKHKCYICKPNTVWIKTGEYSKHMKTHKINDEYVCPIPQCVFRASELRNYNTHVHRHESLTLTTEQVSNANILVKQFICCFCVLSGQPISKWTNRSFYTSHLKTHRGENGVYVCPICHNSNSNVSRINQHMKESHREALFNGAPDSKSKGPQRIFWCRICSPNIKFPHQSAFQLHMKSSHQNSNGFYNCPFCKFYSTQSIRPLTEHMKKHDGREGISQLSHVRCLLCIPFKAYTTIENYTHHVECIHRSREGNFVCPICSTKADTIEVISSHMETHKDLIPMYFCRFCNPPSLWFYRELYLAHIKRQHAGGNGKYTCPLCSKYTANSVQVIARHISNHQRYTSRKGIILPWVKAAVNTAREKQMHEPSVLVDAITSIKVDESETTKPVHTQPHNCISCEDIEPMSTFSCKYCPTMQNLPKMAFQEHMTIFHPHQPCPFGNYSSMSLTLICLACGFLANSTQDLSSHMDSTHNKKGKLCCSNCGLKFKNQLFLDRHVEMIHSHGKGYNCSICHKNYFCLLDLKRHRRIHTDYNVPNTSLNEFCCPLCNKQCRTKKSFGVHKRRTCKFSIGRKMNFCRICKRTYSGASSLKRHVQTIHCGIGKKKSERTVTSFNSKDGGLEDAEDLFL